MGPTLSTKTLGDVFSDTWNIYKDNFWGIVKISAIVQFPAMILFAILVVIVLVAFYVLGAFDVTGDQNFTGAGTIAGFVSTYVLLVALFSLIYIAFEGVVTHAVCQAYIGQPIGISVAFRRTFQRFWTMVGAWILAFVTIATIFFISLLLRALTGGFVGVVANIIWLMVLPFGTYLGVRWYFVLQAALLEGASPLEALRGSSELVEDNWWRVLGITIVVWLAIFAASIFLMLIPIIGTLFVYIVVWPAFMIAKTVLYCDLRMRAEGPEQFNEDALARDLGLVPVNEQGEGWSKFNPA